MTISKSHLDLGQPMIIRPGDNSLFCGFLASKRLQTFVSDKIQEAVRKTNRDRLEQGLEIKNEIQWWNPDHNEETPLHLTIIASEVAKNIGSLEDSPKEFQKEIAALLPPEAFLLKPIGIKLLNNKYIVIELENGPEMQSLHEKILDVAKKYGFDFRPEHNGTNFYPHMTVGKIPKPIVTLDTTTSKFAIADQKRFAFAQKEIAKLGLVMKEKYVIPLICYQVIAKYKTPDKTKNTPLSQSLQTWFEGSIKKRKEVGIQKVESHPTKKEHIIIFKTAQQARDFAIILFDVYHVTSNKQPLQPKIVKQQVNGPSLRLDDNQFKLVEGTFSNLS